MGEVSAGVEGHAHDRVARLADRHGNSHVGLCTGVRLYVRILTAEQLLRTLDRDGLDFVDIDTATVVTLARVTLGVLVGQHGAHGHHGRTGYDVLRCDELDVVHLAVILAKNRRADLRICLRDVVHYFLDHNLPPLFSSKPAHALSW